ncbi:hypothetical protein GRJ2_003437200 [Grus japonensis]|uniref:RNase H type-1 domain-containing protein n=1 Tax=Grus japonensis TaxID=30415 RepID=A0ABC9YK81_GRUJA
MQRAQLGKPNHPGILEEIMDWPEGRDFGALPEEVACAQEAPPYNELPEDERRYALFTDGSCRVVGNHRKWKAAVWSPTRQVIEATEGEGESSQFAEVKAIQLAVGEGVSERLHGAQLPAGAKPRHHTTEEHQNNEQADKAAKIEVAQVDLD